MHTGSSWGSWGRYCRDGRKWVQAGAVMVHRCLAQGATTGRPLPTTEHKSSKPAVFSQSSFGRPENNSNTYSSLVGRGWGGEGGGGQLVTWHDTASQAWGRGSGPASQQTVLSQIWIPAFFLEVCKTWGLLPGTQGRHWGDSGFGPPCFRRLRQWSSTGLSSSNSSSHHRFFLQEMYADKTNKQTYPSMEFYSCEAQ